jgi:hypothetical protein
MGAAGTGAALVLGARTIVLRNEKKRRVDAVRQVGFDRHRENRTMLRGSIRV